MRKQICPWKLKGMVDADRLEWDFLSVDHYIYLFVCFSVEKETVRLCGMLKGMDQGLRKRKITEIAALLRVCEKCLTGDLEKVHNSISDRSWIWGLGKAFSENQMPHVSKKSMQIWLVFSFFFKLNFTLHPTYLEFGLEKMIPCYSCILGMMDEAKHGDWRY